MANPEAVMRAAQKPPMMPGAPMGGGMPPEMPPKPPDAPSEAPKPPEGRQGMDGMVEALKGVGEFLQSQGPGGQEAMGHFQALLQSMAKIGGGEAPQAGGPMPLAKDGGGPGRVHESKVPGVQVL